MRGKKQSKKKVHINLYTCFDLFKLRLTHRYQPYVKNLVNPTESQWANNAAVWKKTCCDQGD